MRILFVRLMHSVVDHPLSQPSQNFLLMFGALIIKGVESTRRRASPSASTVTRPHSVRNRLVRIQQRFMLDKFRSGFDFRISGATKEKTGHAAHR
jgi:hypothetical protein